MNDVLREAIEEAQAMRMSLDDLIQGNYLDALKYERRGDYEAADELMAWVSAVQAARLTERAVSNE